MALLRPAVRIRYTPFVSFFSFPPHCMVSLPVSFYESLRGLGASSHLYYLNEYGELTVKRRGNSTHKWCVFLPACYSFAKIKRCIREYLQETIASSQMEEDSRRRWQQYLQRHPVRVLFGQVFLQMDKEDWNWNTQLDNAKWRAIGVALKIEQRRKLESLFKLTHQGFLCDNESLQWNAPDSLEKVILSKNLKLYADRLKSFQRFETEQHYQVAPISKTFEMFEHFLGISKPSISEVKEKPCVYEIVTPSNHTIQRALGKWIEYLETSINLNQNQQHQYKALFSKISGIFYNSKKIHGLECLAAVLYDENEEEKLAGFVLYRTSHTKPSCINVEFLIVDPSEQRKGAGSSLLSKLLFQSSLKGYLAEIKITLDAIQDPILRNFYLSETKEFYRKHGFRIYQNKSGQYLVLTHCRANELMRGYWHRYMSSGDIALESRFEKALPLIQELKSLQVNYDSIKAHALIKDLKGHVMLTHFLQNLIRQHEGAFISPSTSVSFSPTATLSDVSIISTSRTRRSQSWAPIAVIHDFEGVIPSPIRKRANTQINIENLEIKSERSASTTPPVESLIFDMDD